MISDKRDAFQSIYHRHRLVSLGLPPLLNILPGTIFAVWNTFAGGNNTVATVGSAVGTYVNGQPPDNLIDTSLTSRYSSRGSSLNNDSIAGLNTGFFATVAQCQPVLVGFRLANAYPDVDREPLTLTVEGTNCTDVIACVSWMLLYNGSTGLDVVATAYGYGDFRPISNSAIYKSYRFLMTSKRSVSSLVTYGGVQLFGYSNQSTSSQNTTSS